MICHFGGRQTVYMVVHSASGYRWGTSGIGAEPDYFRDPINSLLRAKSGRIFAKLGLQTIHERTLNVQLSESKINWQKCTYLSN